MVFNADSSPRSTLRGFFAISALIATSWSICLGALVSQSPSIHDEGDSPVTRILLVEEQERVLSAKGGSGEPSWTITGDATKVVGENESWATGSPIKIRGSKVNVSNTLSSDPPASLILAAAPSVTVPTQVYAKLTGTPRLFKVAADGTATPYVANAPIVLERDQEATFFLQVDAEARDKPGVAFLTPSPSLELRSNAGDAKLIENVGNGRQGIPFPVFRGPLNNGTLPASGYQFKLVGRSAGNFKLSLYSVVPNGTDIEASYAFTIQEPLSKPKYTFPDGTATEGLVLLEGQRMVITATFSEPIGTRTVSWQINSDPTGAVTSDAPQPTGLQVTLVANRDGKATVQALVDGKAIDGDQAVNVRVIPKVNEILLAGMPPSFVVNQRVNVTLLLRDARNRQLGVHDYNYTVSSDRLDIVEVYRDPQDLSKITIDPKASGEATITVDLGSQPPKNFKVKVSEVGYFGPLPVRMYDPAESEVRRLFGSSIADEYWVKKITITNNYTGIDASGKKVGKTIIVYSNSINAAVTLQKRYDSKQQFSYARRFYSNGDPRPSTDHVNDWSPVSERDLFEAFTFLKQDRLNPLPPQYRKSTMTRATSKSEITVSERELAPFRMSPGDQRQLAVSGLRDGKLPTWSEEPTSDVIDISASGSLIALKPGVAKVKVSSDGTELAAYSVIVVPRRLQTVNTVVKGGVVEAQTVVVGEAVTVIPPVRTMVGIKWKPISESTATLDPDTGVLVPRAVGPLKIEGEGLANGIKIEFVALVDAQPRSDEFELPPSTFDEDGKLMHAVVNLRQTPNSIEFMLLGASARENSRPRVRTEKLLDLFASSLSAATSFGAIRDTNAIRYITGANSFVFPAIQSRFPDMAESDRSNLVRKIMQPMEEVVFGGTIERYLFFPKLSNRIQIPGYQTRISRVIGTDFNIEVAVVEDKRTLPVNSGQTTNSVGGGATTPPPSANPRS